MGKLLSYNLSLAWAPSEAYNAPNKLKIPIESVKRDTRTESMKIMLLERSVNSRSVAFVALSRLLGADWGWLCCQNCQVKSSKRQQQC